MTIRCPLVQFLRVTGWARLWPWRLFLCLTMALAGCVPSTCETGAMRCDSDRVVQCVAGQWETVLPCSDVGRACVEVDGDELWSVGVTCGDAP